VVGSRDRASIPDGRQATVTVKGSETPEEGNHSRLIEAMLLESDAKYECGTADSCVSEGLGSVILNSFNDDQNMEKETGMVSECGFEFYSQNHQLHLLESKLQTLNVKCDSGGGHCEETQGLGLGACNLVSQERKVPAGHLTPENETVEKKLSGPEACKEKYYSNSFESEFLKSQIPHDFEGDVVLLSLRLGHSSASSLTCAWRVIWRVIQTAGHLLLNKIHVIPRVLSRRIMFCALYVDQIYLI
jgi:hypothetical protein